MKKLKSAAIMLIAVCMFLITGCGDEFTPTSMEFDIVGNSTYSATKVCDDQKLTREVWKLCTDVIIDYDTEGEMGTEYIYVAFFDDQTDDYGVFTLYSNGSCCLAEEFDVFYSVKNGEKIYQELLEYYEQLPENE